MSDRYYGKKVKRSRNLYSRRKSSVHKLFEITGMLAVVAFLIFVGYAAGKPLLEFLTDKEAEDVSTNDTPESEYEWKPPIITITGIPDKTTTQTDENTAVTTVVQEPEPNTETLNAVYAPSSALANSSSLSAYLQKIKAERYNAAVIDLKDNSGYLWYKSGLSDLIINESAIIKGTMTLKQIKTVFDEAGIIPVVRINTLQDHLAPKEIADVTYRFADDSYAWLDDYADRGGKQWANPFLSGTRAYISGIVEEAAKEGFKEIILANIVFPEFRPYDISILSSQITDINTRYAGLTGLVQECADKKGESRLILEISLLDALENYSGFKKTAEVLRGRSSQEMSGVDGIMSVFNKSETGTELRTGESTTTTLPADIKSLVNLLYKQAARNLSNEIIIPCIDKNSLSDSDLKLITEQLGEMGYESILIK